MAFGKGKKELRPDIAAARSAITLKGTVGIGKAVDGLEALLWPGETVAAMTLANHDGPAILVLTDRRVLLSSHHLGGKSQSELALDRITTVAFKSKVALTRTGTIELSASGGGMKVEGILGDEGERIISAIRQQMAAASAPQSTPAAAPPPPSAVPAGWYPDKAAGVQRYWDGTAWTEHTAPLPGG